MTGSPRKPVRINVQLPGELHHRLRLRALEEATTLAELIPRLLCETMGVPVAEAKPEEGKKGGVVYSRGGLPAGVCCDR